MTYIPPSLQPEHEAVIQAQLQQRRVRALVRGSVLNEHARQHMLDSLTVIEEFLVTQREDIEYRAHLLAIATSERVLDEMYRTSDTQPLVKDDDPELDEILNEGREDYELGRAEHEDLFYGRPEGGKYLCPRDES